MDKVQNIDTKLLYFYIEKSGLKKSFICETLGLSLEGFKKKCKGIIKFRMSEVYVLCDILKIPNEDKKKIFFPNS